MLGTDESQSGLSPLKLAWLAALTLVAGTLSTRAWVMPTENESAKAESGRSGSTNKTDDARPESENEQAFEIAPQADVWHGVAERPPVERPTGTSEHLSTVAGWKPAHHPRITALWIRLLPQGSPRQRCRFICRDAHAPPVSG